jgi:VanZ family protein
LPSISETHLLTLWRLLAWCALLTVVAGSLHPAPPLPEFQWSDKLFHIVAYFGLMVLFGEAYPNRLRTAALGLIMLGMLLELLQGLSGTRFAEWSDAVANTLGVGVGVLSLCAGFKPATWCQRCLLGSR